MPDRWPTDKAAVRQRGTDDALGAALDQLKQLGWGCVFLDTKVQLLDASGHILVERAEPVAGIRVAGLGDLMAMKLRAVTSRGEHRDYLDLTTIENNGRRMAEEGLAHYVGRFEPDNPADAVATVLRSLGYLGDVEDDPALAISVEELQAFWSSRLPGIGQSVSRYGYDYDDGSSSADAEGEAATVAGLDALRRIRGDAPIGVHLAPYGRCRARTRKRRRCPLDALADNGVCGVHRLGRRPG